MRKIDIVEHINGIQSNLDIPSCFVLSKEKLRSDETLMVLINRITTNSMRDGDILAITEIIKEWIAQNQENTPD